MLAGFRTSNPPVLSISIIQRLNSTSTKYAKPNKNAGNDKNGESNGENKKFTTGLVKLIDQFEDAILRDLDKSYPMQNSTDEVDIIDDFLRKPTWSTKDEYGQIKKGNEQKKEQKQENLDNSIESSCPISVSDEEIQRLLRLSALPPANDPHQLDILREDLKSQLAFVRMVQFVDTEGIEPLVCMRDETTEGLRDSTITLDDLKTVLSKEYRVGKCQRPRRQLTQNLQEDTNWNVFANSENVIEMNGEKYFIVKHQKSSNSPEIKEKIAT